MKKAKILIAVLLFAVSVSAQSKAPDKPEPHVMVFKFEENALLYITNLIKAGRVALYQSNMPANVVTDMDQFGKAINDSIEHQVKIWYPEQFQTGKKDTVNHIAKDTTNFYKEIKDKEKKN